MARLSVMAMYKTSRPGRSVRWRLAAVIVIRSQPARCRGSRPSRAPSRSNQSAPTSTGVHQYNELETRQCARLYAAENATAYAARDDLQSENPKQGQTRPSRVRVAGGRKDPRHEPRRDEESRLEGPATHQPECRREGEEEGGKVDGHPREFAGIRGAAGGRVVDRGELSQLSLCRYGAFGSRPVRRLENPVAQQYDQHQKTRHGPFSGR